MTFGEALATMVNVLSAPNLERTGVAYEVKVGDEHLDANGAPPRIVIVPTNSQPGPARGRPTNEPRGLPTETHLFTAELWAKAPAEETVPGKDYVAVSTMRATFVAAMRATFGNAFTLGPGEWSATEGESMEEDGRSYLQQFTLATLFLDFSPSTALVETTLTNAGATNPGQDFP